MGGKRESPAYCFLASPRRSSAERDSGRLSQELAVPITFTACFFDELEGHVIFVCQFYLLLFIQGLDGYDGSDDFVDALVSLSSFGGFNECRGLLEGVYPHVLHDSRVREGGRVYSISCMTVVV